MGRIPAGLALLTLLAVSGCQEGMFARPRMVYGADILEEKEVPADAPMIAELPPPPPAAPSLDLALDNEALPAIAPPQAAEEQAPAPEPEVTEVAVIEEAAPEPVSEPAPEPAAAKTHVIQKGETLQKISQRYYGTTRRWPAIFKANEAAMKSPDKIKVGMTIVLPD